METQREHSSYPKRWVPPVDLMTSALVRGLERKLQSNTGDRREGVIAAPLLFSWTLPVLLSLSTHQCCQKGNYDPGSFE